MTEQVQEQEVQLSLNDIAAVVQIIDVVTKRGAFEGTELEAVGILRNRFAKFVEARNPAQAEAAATPEATENKPAE